MNDDIHFSTLKEDRGWYFVEYHPPSPSLPFAILHIGTAESPSINAIVEAVELEARDWIARYPVPLMASAYDRNGDDFDLKSVRQHDYLVAIPPKSFDDKPIFEWRELQSHEHPAPLNGMRGWLVHYPNVPYKTKAECLESLVVEGRQNRLLLWVLILWGAVIPALIAILGAANKWIGIAGLVYSFGKAAITALKLAGKWKPSKRELAREEEDRLMRHHHYHCVRNPEAFLKLKIENFEKDQREHIARDAAALKQKTN